MKSASYDRDTDSVKIGDIPVPEIAPHVSGALCQ
jgi:hypothetical protein